MTHSRHSGESSTAGSDTERSDRRFRRYVVLALALVTVALVALGSFSVYVTHEERLAIAALERQIGDLKSALAGLPQQLSENRTALLALQGELEAYRAALAAQQKRIQENKPAVATPQQQIQEGKAGLAVPEQQIQENRSAVAVARQDSFAAGALAETRGVLAQPARKVYRIGILGTAAGSDLAGPQPRSPTTLAFLRGMREQGYVYGEHFVTEVRGADGKLELFPGLAAELVGLQVDVIVAPGPALPALKRATSTIPIVMAAASDPVGSGYVQSLSRPGGNVTGLSLQSVDTVGKRLELLKELVPGASPVAVLWDRGNVLFWPAAEAAARGRGWKVLPFEVWDAGQIEAAFKAATDAGAGALLVDAGAVIFPQRQRVVALAAKYRLPAMYELRPFVYAGGLISYGTDINDIWRRAAVCVDKILKGAKAADLPVEQPTKFELVINLKTAKALGLGIPPSMLLRADVVIQ